MAGDLRRHRAHYDGIVMRVEPSGYDISTTDEALFRTIHFIKINVEPKLAESMSWFEHCASAVSNSFDVLLPNLNWSELSYCGII